MYIYQVHNIITLLTTGLVKMFPTINHINDLLPYIEGNSQFRVAEQPNGCTIVCYMLQDEDTFSGEHEDWYKECRGITFDTKTGQVVARTLHKFKNVGESEDTAPALIPWGDVVRVMDKRDGSMITPVLTIDDNGEYSIVCKTKKTFTSAEAIEATKLLNADQAKVDWITGMLLIGFTPTFEWTSPRFPIVLTYEKDELTLLQIRDNVTGEYVHHTAQAFDKAKCPFPVVENLIEEFLDEDGNVSWDIFQNAALTRTGVEGWIIQTTKGEMWKIKTKWYCELHHAVTFTRWRDVARIVAADASDDLKAAFKMTGRSIDPILEVERKMKATIEVVRDQVEAYAAGGKHFNHTAKEMALMYKDNPNFSLIMKVYRGAEINWLEWYAKYHVDGWGLEVIPVCAPNEEA